MDINELIAIVKKKLESQIIIENIIIEDKSFLHKKHVGNEPNRFHLKISLKSEQLRKMKKIDSNKKIYKVLSKEMKDFIHSLQILID